MKSELLTALLEDKTIKTILLKGKELYWKTPINSFVTYNEFDWDTVCRVSILLSNAALVSDIKDKNYAEESYILLFDYPIHNPKALDKFEHIAGYDFIDKSILYYFYISSLALKLNKTISARLILKSFDADSPCEETDWRQRTIYIVIKSLILLIRKSQGMSDIKKALNLINCLRSEQKDFEEKYISSYSTQNQPKAALSLVAIYHVSKALTETADYLIKGYSMQQRRITSSIRQHIDIALNLIPKESRLNDFFIIIQNDLQLLIKNSIWTNSDITTAIKKLCQSKAAKGILELLPSQQEALENNMLNVAANAIVLQMPTSAGKTLMAEFNILVTRSLRPDAKIIYVVPSRALMNQIYFDLNDDLGNIGYSIERTSAAVEVDPTENNFLDAENIDILVTTPEKLDLLVRRNHPSVEDVSLFIIDEAHTIENGIRGARLELLMTMLLRERPRAKFMLLSPFLPDGGEKIKDWLGGGNAIHVDWKPSEKIIFGLQLSSKKVKYEVLPTPFSSIIKEPKEYILENDINLCSRAKKEKILEYSTKKFGKNGRTLLILCKGRETANKTAEKIFNWQNTSPAISSDVALVQKYMNEEIGCPTLYTKLLSKGITVHHAGLSDESKILIEHLIRKGEIRYVCATTTIAEGVNFPVSSVYFDTYMKGSSKLTSNDFWNIVGRAGRTLIDNFGKIILPFNTPKNKEEAQSIISKSAEQLTSVLSKLFIDRIKIIQQLDDSNNIKKLADEYQDSFGPLFQYFVHLLNVGKNDYVADIEDLFKDTLEYNLLSFNEQADFIYLCKRIYLTIQRRYSKETGVLRFADKTGFSVPSVLEIMRQNSVQPEISNLDSWKVEALFNKHNPKNLANKISVIAKLKETKLGTDSKKGSFDPVIVSKMLIGWVKGEKLNALSKIHPKFAKMEDTSIRVSEFVNHMNGMRFKASWGLSALEGIVRGNENEIRDSYIPSYIYYGVDNNKALALRMLGIPRSLSSSMSKVLTKEINQYSFSKIRDVVKDLSNNNWDEVRPQNSKLSGEEWKRIVELLIK